ncbi:MAG: transglycosylase SLT domain-containing protein [Nitrospirae bacterium]|nr:transglycosylase SLT domain-containing protein [Nitrospirota bacterium]
MNKRKFFLCFFISLLAINYFFLVGNSQAINITCPDEVLSNGTATCTASECGGTVSWGATGTGATISNGTLTTVSSCGAITVAAGCEDGSIATKAVRISNAGGWVNESNTLYCYWDRSVFLDNCYIGDTWTYTAYGIYGTCGSGCFPRLGCSLVTCGMPSPREGCNSALDVPYANYCVYVVQREIYEWQCSSCTNNDNDGYTTCNGDCDDTNPNIRPGAPEICGDLKDNNCNGQVDEGCCVDNDGDGHYAISGSCPAGDDCNDNNAAIYPGANEICDGIDNDCNGQKDETCVGQTSNNICLDSSANVGSGNFYHSQTLFTLPNAKPSLEIALSYNSLDTNTGSFGRSWTHNFNITLTTNPDGSLRLKGSDGNTTYFRLSGGAYYPDPQSGDSSQIVKNPDNTYTQTQKDGIVYTFNTSGLLTEIKDRNGNTTTLNYTGSDLVSIIDSTGRTTSSAVSSGKIISITDPAGSINTFTYSGDLLTAITDPKGNSWTYGYDGNGRMTTKTDPGGNTITYVYDAQGRLFSSIDPEAKTKTITYDQINNIATILEKDSGTWLQKYDPLLNVPKEKTDPDGNITRYTYDSNRNLLTETDALGHVTTYTYDSNRNITSITDDLGHTVSYTYNTLNKVTSITDQTGNITTFTYDDKGNLLTVTDPEGGQTLFTYDSRGNIISIISITDPADQTTIIEYDSYNNPVTIKDPTETVFKYTYTYDIMGNILSSPNPPTQYEYNSLNQLIKITDVLNNITTFTYDPNGNKQTITDANGNITTYEHNYRGQIKKITDALNNITTFIYGGTGCPSCSGVDKLTSLTDAKGHITSFEYDKRGNLKKETDPLGYTTIYTYDGANNLISKTDANGNTTTYQYDALNRLTKKTYPDSATETFTYDAKGNILTAANLNISYTFIYDKANRLTSTTDSSGKTITYQYYSTGNRKQMALPDGRIVTYTYDPANRPFEIQTIAGTFTIAYDTLGKRTSLTHPNGTSATYAYDVADRLTSLLTQNSIPSTIDSYTYTHDKVANRKTMSDTLGTHNYDYDNIYQLKQATHPTTSTEKFSYDFVGNRTNTTVDTANRLLENATYTFAYDNNGNLIQRTTKSTGDIVTYAYDESNRLIQMNKTGTVATYKYDPFGRRIEKKVNSTTTKYLYDGEDIVIQYNGSGGITARFTHGPGIDEPLSIEKSGQRYYYHADGLGSIKVITDSTGGIIKTYNYKAYGAIASQSGTLSQPYMFTSREYDSETGFYYYRGRYYNPGIGRFISKDPIGFGGGINLYVYVHNRPTMLVDPLGLSPLAYAEIVKIVTANNLSGQSNEIIICIAFMESSFNPIAMNPRDKSTAWSLMGLTVAATKDVNVDYFTLDNPVTSIKAGSQYLKKQIKDYHYGNVVEGLSNYGEGPAYAAKILECEKCLKDSPCDSKKCLNQLHPGRKKK